MLINKLIKLKGGLKQVVFAKREETTKQLLFFPQSKRLVDDYKYHFFISLFFHIHGFNCITSISLRINPS